MIKNQGLFVCISIACFMASVSWAAPDIQFSVNNAGQMSLQEGKSTLADRIGVSFIQKNWKGTFDEGTRIEILENTENKASFRGTLVEGAEYVVQVQREDARITYTIDVTLSKPMDLNGVILKFHLPIAVCGQGGTFQFSNHPKQNFPESLLDNNILFGGAVKEFAWTDGIGHGMKITAPCDLYMQLQDDRKFQMPQLCYFVDMGVAGSVGKTSRTLTITSLETNEKARPVVDRFGQSTRHDWPGKVTSDEQLRGDIEDENKWMAAFGEKPKGWDQYGGLAGTKEKYGLKATGNFRVDKVDGRDVFVTPEGNVFFSSGAMFIDCDQITITSNRESLFEWLPEVQGKFGPNNVVNFHGINLARKYGPEDAYKKDMEHTTRRCWAWGFNTTGAFSVRLPGVPSMPMFHEFFSHFMTNIGPDVFDPNFAVALDAACEKNCAPLKDDKYLIGYFLSNEVPLHKLVTQCSQLPGQYYTKKEFIAFLQKRYPNIKSFNIAWDMKAGSFDELVDLSFPTKTKKALKDSNDFLAYYCDTLGRLLQESVKRYDPNHLLVGHRWLPHTASNDTVVKHLGQYLDVVSINYYHPNTPSEEYLRHIHEVSGKPIILSEWSYGCADRGHSGGVRDVGNQHERGLYYRNYVEQTAKLPYVIGHQWFTAVDMALTGRVWGDPDTAERYQDGLVDVTDRPYRELLEEAVKTNHRIYDVVFGKVTPYSLPTEIIGSRNQQKQNVIIPRRQKELTIDGDMADWPQAAPQLTLSSRNRVDGSSKIALDLSAEVWLQWDESNLYVLAQVNDPTPMTNQSQGQRIWNGDALELFLSTQASDQAGALMEGDYQVGISTGCPEKNIPPSTWNWTIASEVQGAETACTRREGNIPGYILEVKLPISAFPGLKVKEGLKINFDLGLDNGDVKMDGARSVQLMWHGLEGNSYDRSGWGHATFVR